MNNYDPADYGYCPYCGRKPHRVGCPAYEPEPMCRCELCGGAIYSGETIFRMEEAAYHVECFKDEYECEA